MATIASNAFEIERRFIQLKYNTNLPSNTTLGWDSDPNTVTNGATEGQTLVYNVAMGASFVQSNGALWFKSALPNTWIQMGGATTVASNVITYTIPSGNTQLFYTLALANNKNFEWTVNSTLGASLSLAKISGLYNGTAMTWNEYSFLGENFDTDILIAVSGGTHCTFSIKNNEATSITVSVKVEAFNAL